MSSFDLSLNVVELVCCGEWVRSIWVINWPANDLAAAAAFINSIDMQNVLISGNMAGTTTENLFPIINPVLPNYPTGTPYTTPMNGLPAGATAIYDYLTGLWKFAGNWSSGGLLALASAQYDVLNSLLDCQSYTQVRRSQINFNLADTAAYASFQETYVYTCQGIALWPCTEPPGCTSNGTCTAPGCVCITPTPLPGGTAVQTGPFDRDGWTIGCYVQPTCVRVLYDVGISALMLSNLNNAVCMAAEPGYACGVSLVGYGTLPPSQVPCPNGDIPMEPEP